LETLTSRAKKQPKGLIDCLQTLIDVANRGLLKGPSNPKPKQQKAAKSKPERTNSKKPSVPTPATSQKPNRWSRSKEWHVRAHDWGVKEVCRGSEKLCAILDDLMTPESAEALLCQVSTLDEWHEALAVASGASLKNFALVFQTTDDLDLVGNLRFKGWTLEKMLCPGLANQRLVQKTCWLARASMLAPRLNQCQTVTTVKRPIVSKPKVDDSYVLKISCDLRFQPEGSHKTIMSGPGQCFRMWMNELDSTSRDLVLNIGDTWGFHEVPREHLVCGLVRVRGKDRAMKLLAASGRYLRGQVWWADAFRWDSFTDNPPRTVWHDKRLDETELQFVRRMANDAGQFGMVRGRVQIGLRLPPSDERLGPRVATWRAGVVPRSWELEHVTDTMQQLGFSDIQMQCALMIVTSFNFISMLKMMNQPLICLLSSNPRYASLALSCRSSKNVTFRLLLLIF
jgi:hypothetical protein